VSILLPSDYRAFDFLLASLAGSRKFPSTSGEAGGIRKLRSSATSDYHSDRTFHRRVDLRTLQPPTSYIVSAFLT